MVTNSKRSQGFTLLDRLLLIIKTPSGRKHLRKTWRFALGEAYRAASGIQVSAVLRQLDLLSRTLNNSLDLPVRESFSRKEFTAIAKNLGAGKRGGHEYAYQYLDLDRLGEISILEIGIGTNDPKAPSSMGKDGKPGSSLEMWIELFPNANVVGADIDPGALVQGDRISSFLVDSTDQESIKELVMNLEVVRPSGFDLIIDDGLHTPESNLSLFNLLSPLLRTRGFYVVEDIPKAWSGFWKVVARAVSRDFQSVVVEDHESIEGSLTFVVLKKY